MKDINANKNDKASMPGQAEKSKEMDSPLLAIDKQYKSLKARYTALFKLNQLSNQCADLDDFYSQVHRIISSLMVAENFFVVLYDQVFSTLEFVYHVDKFDKVPQGHFNYDDLKGSLTHLIIESGQPLFATPSLIKQLSDQNILTGLGQQATDWLGVPLMNNGVVIGVMVVQGYDQDSRYQEEDLDLLTYTAQHIVTAMARLQDLERLQDAVDARTRELMQQIRDREKSELLQSSLYKISELSNDLSIDINLFYQQVHSIITKLVYAENLFITLYNKESNTLNFTYYSDQNSSDLIQDFKPRVFGKGYTELVIRSGESTLLSHAQMIDLYERGVTYSPQVETTSWLGIPLFNEGDVIGAMVIQSYDRAIQYTSKDAELLNFVTQHIAIAINKREVFDDERRYQDLLEGQVKLRTTALEEEVQQRRKAEEKLKYAASHDSLTGLVNRSSFTERLNHAIEGRKHAPQLTFAVLFLDLDRFKMVNDSLGHHAGDILLKRVATELCKIVRDEDTVARLGGDEFVILIEDLENDQGAFYIAQRIADLLKKPFTIDNQSVFTGTSIGLLFSADRYTDAVTMLRDADIAMYQAKSNGRGRYEVFDSSMHQKVQDALILETDLREAIALNEFVPYFQPIISLTDDKIVGFEALARWESPKRGFVYPEEFISLAEETGLVKAIDMQILEASCLQLKQWQNIVGYNELYISCNLYCNHFFRPNLPIEIKKIIYSVGIPADKLRIELTERALLENSDLVLKNMNTLKNMGVKILLDDFGTGYSSLSYLHRFPIDILKIDRSFIHNINQDASHRAIIKTIIDLAANLDMATVGEGIENLADSKLLAQMDCMYGQGFFFSEPMSGEKTNEFLASNLHRLIAM